MAISTQALDADWLGACRRATESLRAILLDAPGTDERAVEVGTRGEGGDRTLVIDAQAEDAVFGQLEELHDAGARFSAISEERGSVDFGDPAVIVVIDPIDGSLNAKRGLPQHAISIAVADGDTMADVVFGFVHDFGAREEWVARRGDGAWLNGRRLGTDACERRTPDGRLELLGIEAADPRRMRESADRLEACAYRIRALGTMAVSLCQLAAARFDGLVSLKPSRAVDVAAAQLIVREAGGLIAFPAFADPLGAPLDAVPHSPIVGARTSQGLTELTRVPLIP